MSPMPFADEAGPTIDTRSQAGSVLPPPLAARLPEPPPLAPVDAALGSPPKTVSVRLPHELWLMLNDRADALAQEMSSAPSARQVLTEAMVRVLDDPDLAAHAALVGDTARREAIARTQRRMGAPRP